MGSVNILFFVVVLFLQHFKNIKTILAQRLYKNRLPVGLAYELLSVDPELDRPEETKDTNT